MQTDNCSPQQVTKEILQDGKNLISRVTILEYIKCSNSQPKLQSIQRKKKTGAFTRKRILETIPEEFQTLELLAKVVKSSALYMLKLL